MDAALVAARDVSVRFAGTLALDTVSVSVHAGEVLAVVGANGSGKSTLLRVLCGVLRPTKGSVLWHGEATRFREPRDAVKRGIALVTQEPEVAESLAAWENVLLGRASLAGRAAGRRERRAARDLVADALPGCDPDTPAGRLRKADRAVLAMIRATERRPSVLALDEPTAVLGDSGAKIVAGKTREIQAGGGGVILVSHRIADVLGLATRIIVLVDGRIVMNKPRSDVSADEIVAHMAEPGGHKTDDQPAGRSPTPSEDRDAMVKLVGVRARRGLRADYLEVKRGEILGVAGLSGSGRSRLCGVLAGSERYGGDVTLEGRRLAGNIQAHLRMGVGYVPEDRKREAIFPSLSVERNIEVASIGAGRLARWTGRGAAKDIAARMAEFAVKAPSPRSQITALSGGNQQLVVLCRVLGADPKVLVADEPTQGVDHGRRAAIHEMLRAYCAKGGAVLLVMSDFAELLELSSRVVVLHDGTLITGLPTSCDERLLMRLATGVEANAGGAAPLEEAQRVS